MSGLRPGVMYYSDVVEEKEPVGQDGKTFAIAKYRVTKESKAAGKKFVSIFVGVENVLDFQKKSIDQIMKEFGWIRDKKGRSSWAKTLAGKKRKKSTK